eukprot:TRINITY_DN101_c11_g1_i1.p1 TRINITY_DN101_c11_g1~~TRINITY_DN101_c11_g1_i1.p1  ORF type:complete len:532 (+),score=167.88 TRINITY_DN101_c11_g1_i1:43-1638(+)
MQRAAAVCCVAAACAMAEEAAPKTKKPNFVVLFADDMGYGDMGANDPSAAGMTPHLDQLAAEGIRFTDFHVAASVCSVSRAALLTGRLGLRTGVVHNFSPTSRYGLPRTEVTLAEALQKAGYRTGAIGKWHLGTTPGYHPTYRGFDKYLGIPYSVDMGCTDVGGYDLPHAKVCSPGPLPPGTGTLPLPLYRSDVHCNGANATCDGAIVEQPVNFSTLSGRYAAFADEFIGNATKDAKPFFLYVPFSHIHTPQYVAPRNAGRSGKAGRAGHFYDTLMELDDTVGSIVASLKTHGVEEDTLVFFTADNGPWEVKCDLTGSVGPFTGLWQKTHGGGGSSAKTTLWEGGHRVIGLARWSGRIAPRVSAATASSLDYFPTLLRLAGVPVPADRAYDGVDLSDVLFHGAETAHTTLFHPNSGASGVNGALDAVRWNDDHGNQWKAIYQTGGAPACGGGHGTVAHHDVPLLFNLAEDPAESTALDTAAAPYKAVVEEITRLRAAQMQSVNGTYRSVVDYSAGVQYEPCAGYPTDCRSK